MEVSFSSVVLFLSVLYTSFCIAECMFSFHILRNCGRIPPTMECFFIWFCFCMRDSIQWQLYRNLKIWIHNPVDRIRVCPKLILKFESLFLNMSFSADISQLWTVTAVYKYFGKVF